MIRFVDLSMAYWSDPDEPSPACAFVNTVVDRFIELEDGAQVAFDDDDIPGGDLGERLRALVPEGFWNRTEKDPAR